MVTFSARSVWQQVFGVSGIHYCDEAPSAASPARMSPPRPRPSAAVLRVILRSRQLSSANILTRYEVVDCTVHLNCGWWRCWRVRHKLGLRLFIMFTEIRTLEKSTPVKCHQTHVKGNRKRSLYRRTGDSGDRGAGLNKQSAAPCRAAQKQWGQPRGKIKKNLERFCTGSETLLFTD